ncbi:MAG: hypothetical protein JSR28_06165 [Proteobacteria bacterium]|nr:hypothetical protein [Pseudomonadota bacterium]
MTSLKELEIDPVLLQDSTQFALARVMSPAEVAQAVQNHPPEAREALVGRWMVCGDLTVDAFDRWQQRGGANLPWRFSGFTSTDGVHYVVITHQLDDYQHRFMLPTWNRSVRDWVQAADAGESYGFMFGRGGGEAALVVFGRGSRGMFEPTRQFIKLEGPETRRRAIAELPTALSMLGRCDAIPSIVSGFDVTRVSVSVALPVSPMERAEAMH